MKYITLMACLFGSLSANETTEEATPIEESIQQDEEEQNVSCGCKKRRKPNETDETILACEMHDEEISPITLVDITEEVNS